MTAYKTKTLFISLLTSALLTSSVGYSADNKKQFYFLGGGGEPEGDTTIFDAEIKRVGSFTNNSDWETTVSFNGGHSKTEEIIKTKMSKARDAGPFIESNYNALMDEVIAKLETGELKSGDQLMMAIDTHGAKRSSGKNAEKTHKVALSYGVAKELTNLTGASTVDLDKLDKIIELAAKNNVRLAVADLSCYSGNLLNLKNDKVCLISASGPEQYSYGGGVIDLGIFKFSVVVTFASKLFDTLKKGKNLEELFLNSREVGSTPDFPMINTPEGRAINDLMYKMITPYLEYNDQQVTNFGSRYGRTGDKFEEKVCKIEQNHQQLMDLLKQYDQLTAVADEMNNNEFKSLRKSLEEYRKYQIQYEASLRGKFEAESEVKDMLLKQFPNDKKAWEDYAPLDLLSIDYDPQIKRYQELADGAKNNKYIFEMWNSTVKNLVKQKEIATYVKENISDYAKAKLKAQEEAYGKSGVTSKLATNVSKEAKKVYTSLYKSMKSKTSNPCRDFIL